MRAMVFFIVTVIFFSSCLGPAKMNKWVATQYGENISINTKMKADYLTISSSLTGDQKPSTATKNTKNLIPLIFYWQDDYIIHCTLNPIIIINSFSNTVQKYANQKGLKEKLNGNRIELSVDKVPNVFSLVDREHMIWLIYAYSWSNLKFSPDKQDMVVTYRVMNGNMEVKKGELSVPNADKEMKLRYLQNVRKATGEYLGQFDEAVHTMSKKVFDELLKEI